MKKGFTLIELLVVIILLLIVTGISIPIVTKVMDNAHKNILKESANMIIENVSTSISLALSNNEVINYPLEFNIKGEKQISSGNVTMKFNNELPSNGYVIVNENEDVALALFDDDYCLIKEYKKNIEIKEDIDSDTCINIIKNLY